MNGATSFNIAAVARRTGIGAHTLRKWEQRYGVLHPVRTPGGQRRYSDADVARVEWLAARLKQGYRIGEAAAMLTAAQGEAPGCAEELRDALLAAASRSDGEGLGPLLDHAFAIYPLEQALCEIVAPCLVLVGERWAGGELSIGQEHLASSAIRARLERTLADVRPALAGHAVLACAPGELHELGLLMVACLLRAEGWETVYLGQSTPVRDAVAVAREHDALLAISVTMEEHVATLEREVFALESGLPPLTVVGGAAATPALANRLGARFADGDPLRALPELLAAKR